MCEDFFFHFLGLVSLPHHSIAVAGSDLPAAIVEGFTFNRKRVAVSRGNPLLPPLLEDNISTLGEFPLILVLPRFLARGVTSGFVFPCSCLNQTLGYLTKRGYLGSSGRMIGMSGGRERRSLFPGQRLKDGVKETALPLWISEQRSFVYLWT